MSDINQLLEELNQKIKNIQEGNLALETALNALKSKMEKREKTLWEQYTENKENYKPIPEYYYYLDDMENVVCCKFDIHSEASMLQYDAYKKVNNVYENSQQAEQHIENLKTKAELRELANELNGDEVIDWGNENQNKYRLFYNYDRHGVTWGAENNISKAQGAIYCLDEDFLLKAIERIGEQRLINMIKAGV